jgi:hypothetical protein
LKVRGSFLADGVGEGAIHETIIASADLFRRAFNLQFLFKRQGKEVDYGLSGAGNDVFVDTVPCYGKKACIAAGLVEFRCNGLFVCWAASEKPLDINDRNVRRGHIFLQPVGEIVSSRRALSKDR